MVQSKRRPTPHYQATVSHFPCNTTGVTALTVLQELTRLDLLYSWQVTDSVLADLAAMPNLRRLNLTGCHRISRAGRESIAHLLPTDRQELS